MILPMVISHEKEQLGEPFNWGHIPEVRKKINLSDIRTNQSVIWSGDVMRIRPPSVTTYTLFLIHAKAPVLKI